MRMKTENLTKAIILITTYDCNLKCRYCYEPKKARHRMSVEKAKEILRKEIETLMTHIAMSSFNSWAVNRCYILT